MFASFLYHRLRRRNETGFSLLEVVVVLGIILVVFGTALFNLVPALNTAKSNTGMELVLGELRRAHERAVDERRIYRVTFVAPQTIQVDVGQVANIASTVTGSAPAFTQAQPPLILPPGVQFAAVPNPIRLALDSFGRSSGAAFARLASSDDVSRATSSEYNRKMMGPRYVEVFQSTVEDMEATHNCSRLAANRSPGSI